MKSYKSSQFYSNKLSILLVVGIILSAMTAVGLSVGQNQDIRSSAYDVGFCYDKCIGQDRCGNPPGYTPSCCTALKQSGDPFACGWPDRGYCTDDQCNAIPAGVNRQRCGGPRHGWCNLCIQNGCPGYGGVPSQPTNPPQPTRPRNSTNTPAPAINPTATPIVFFPSATPYYIPVTVTPFPSESPNPTEVIIYITTTPLPNPTQPPNYNNHNLIPTTTNTSGTANNNYSSPLDTLKNFLSSFLFTLMPSSHEKQINPSVGPPIENSGPNIFSILIDKIHQFATTIAP